MLRIASVLDDATEALITRIIGICINVHRELGPGLLESLYQRAICLELKTNGLPFEVEKQVPVLSYLRISKLSVGPLMNFNSVVLPNGLKRIVL